MSRTQRIILIIGFVAVVAGLGILLYFVFFRPALTPAGPGNGNGNEGTLPGSNNGGGLPTSNEQTGFPQAGNANEGTNGNQNSNQGVLPAGTEGGVLTETRRLTENTTSGAAVNPDGSLYYYDPGSGKFYFLDSHGVPQLLSTVTFPQVESVTWSPDRDKAVLEYPDGANIIYDFENKTQVSLPTHWEEFSFSPSGDNIVSKNISLNEENNFLIITDSQGTRSRIIRELGSNADQVIASWSPNNSMVGMFVEGSGIDRQEVFFIGQNDENYKSMIVEGWGFEGQWSPQGDKILYSVYNAANDDKPMLWMTDATPNNIGRNRRSIQLETWADKCTFTDNTTVYCAVPQALEAGAGYFPDEMDRSTDDIYKINLSTGSKSLVAQTDEAHTIGSVLVTPDEKTLYFTDKFSGNLYEIDLQQ